DLAFGLYKAAKYYYYPGWHEPGSTMECMINKEALEALDEDLQVIVLNACRVANQDMLADFTARNNAALETLVKEHKVELRRFPDDVLARLKTLSDEVMTEVAAKDPLNQKIFDSFRKFRDQSVEWSRLAEQAYLDARNG
ncbi:MAG: ABC transporter substrate-binding protein, partial [Zoogloeaceae bacterium]|nr:ABC transporter substrate-binding protein [Zoogloeaceae bacterium]